MEKIKHFLILILLSVLTASVFGSLVNDWLNGGLDGSGGGISDVNSLVSINNYGFLFGLFFWSFLISSMKAGKINKKIALISVILAILVGLIATELGIIILLFSLFGALLGLALHPLRRKFFKA